MPVCGRPEPARQVARSRRRGFRRRLRELLQHGMAAARRRRVYVTVSAIEVNMNITAHQVVACERNVAAPRGPNAVWLPEPPKAPAKSAASPLCSRITAISTRQTSDVQRHQDGVNLPADPQQKPRRPETKSPISLRLAFPAPAPQRLKLASRNSRCEANCCASKLAPPTSAPSISACAISPLMLSGLTLPP